MQRRLSWDWWWCTQVGGVHVAQTRALLGHDKGTVLDLAERHVDVFTTQSPLHYLELAPIDTAGQASTVRTAVAPL